MITANVLQRVFNIQIGDRQGTAFTIDHKGRQYLVTARHVVEDLTGAQRIFIVYENQWRAIDINVVGSGEGREDVAVMACSLQLSPTLPLEATSRDLTFGQQAYFLGFPFGWNSGGEHLNRGLPLPLVKGGIVSALGIGPLEEIYLDAHGNHGFSGGPVVFRPSTDQIAFRVAGVVSRFPPRFQSVVDDQGSEIARVLENPGFVIAVGIRHALALIDRNPIGFPLPSP